MRLDIKNDSSHPDAPVQEMYTTIGKQIGHFCNHWAGAWHVVRDLNDQGFYLQLVDDLPEAPGALGYHDVDSDGRPYSKVAVNPSLQNGSDWLTGQYSVISIVGHEALETIGDPLCNNWVDLDQDAETAREMCDAVEDTGRHYHGADITNFLMPAWFNPFGKPPFDDLGLLEAPFTMTAGGYLIVRVGGQVEQETAKGMPEWRKEAARTRGILRGLRVA